MLKWKKDLGIEDIISGLRKKRLLPDKLICPNCEDDMVIHKDSSRKDSFRWVCKKCRKRKPIRVHTWASNYRIPFIELFIIIRYFVEEVDASIAAKRTKIDVGLIEQFYFDLESLIPVYLKKLLKIFENIEVDYNLINDINFTEENYKKIHKLFSLPLIFDIILETLQETY